MRTERLGLKGTRSIPAERFGPAVSLDHASIVEAYRRWADIYDKSFGGVSAKGRFRAVSLANRLPGEQVLEVGVGTGLALPHYNKDKRIVGIDLSSDMLRKARERVRDDGLTNVDALLEMDAESTNFESGRFDIAVGMFVASVVPNPKRLLTEMRRVVKPGGSILFVNHFAADRGPRWWAERALAPLSRRLGWHPDFAMNSMFTADELTKLEIEAVPPFGIFTLVRLDA